MAARSTVRLLAAWVIVATALLPRCSSQHGDGGPGTTAVRIALSRDGITWLPIHLAESLGYYREEGLALSVSEVAGLSKGMEALVVAPAATARIHSVGDLKGRRVGITSPGSPTHLMMNYSLVSHGLSPSDVSTVSISTGAASLAAIERGQVDAAAVVGSAVTVLEHKYRDLTILADGRTPAGIEAAFGSATFPSASLVATGSWLTANHDTIRRLSRATLKAMQWLRSHSAEEARRHIPEELRMPDVDGDLEAIRLYRQNLSTDGSMSPNGIETARRVLSASNDKVRAANLDLSRFYTNDFVKP